MALLLASCDHATTRASPRQQSKGGLWDLVKGKNKHLQTCKGVNRDYDPKALLMG